MANRITDEQSHELLKQVAVGRTAREMGLLLHVAHENVIWQAEREKHQALPDEWNAIKAFLLDGQGTNHIDIALGLALKALLTNDEGEFRFKLRALFKACNFAMPSVRQAIETEIAGGPPPPEIL